MHPKTTTGGRRVTDGDSLSLEKGEHVQFPSVLGPQRHRPSSVGEGPASLRSREDKFSEHRHGGYGNLDTAGLVL
jgi:hypothetical protein